MKTIINLIISVCLVVQVNYLLAQENNSENLPVREYHLTIDEKIINITGKEVKKMAINNSIPGPTLEFNEGELAVIHVTNNMDTETSIHWHGLILPNYQDGVPYLTTPPIKAGTTFTYNIPIKQSGTYWYHSHTMLQEEEGLYGSIVIHPKEETLKVDKDVVLLFSDWTDEKPMSVLKNLKRGNEWYQIKKGTAVPLSRVIKEGAFDAQLKMWRDRMHGADIADIAYDAFLSNGQKTLNLSDLKPGEKVRVRMINGSASTIFWMSFGGNIPTLVAADGIDITPVKTDKLLFAIAETYDLVFTIPESGKLEIRATAQDGSGSTSTYLGTGEIHPAPSLVQPDKVKMMVDMAKMDMKMGAPAIVTNPKTVNPQLLKKEYGMMMNHDMHKNHNMGTMHSNKEMKHSQHTEMNDDSTQKQVKMEHKDHSMEDMEVELNKKDHSQHNNMNHNKKENHQHKNQKAKHIMGGEFTYDEAMEYANYDYLKAKEPTDFKANLPQKELLLNLTGNMNRYVWSMNGVPLSETDDILIKSNEVTRVTLNNMTMMHHPMHLHGHFFRVINQNGEYSPLKHTVNVPPMEEITIEFYNDAEEGDWLFHCHVLYHMMGGMTRIFSYNTPRDPRMRNYSAQTLVKEMDATYNWNTVEATSQMVEADATWSTIRNEVSLNAESNYEDTLEATASYNRYLNSFVRLYLGVSTENESEGEINDLNIVGLAGVKWFTPYMFYIDASLDHQVRPKIEIEKELMLLPRTFLETEFGYRVDFGAVNNLEDNKNSEGETELNIGLEYMFNRDISIKGNYHNEFGWGAGAVLRF